MKIKVIVSQSLSLFLSNTLHTYIKHTKTQRTKMKIDKFVLIHVRIYFFLNI